MVFWFFLFFFPQWWEIREVTEETCINIKKKTRCKVKQKSQTQHSGLHQGPEQDREGLF